MQSGARPSVTKLDRDEFVSPIRGWLHDKLDPLIKRLSESKDEKQTDIEIKNLKDLLEEKNDQKSCGQKQYLRLQRKILHESSIFAFIAGYNNTEVKDDKDEAKSSMYRSKTEYKTKIIELLNNKYRLVLSILDDFILRKLARLQFKDNSPLKEAEVIASGLGASTGEVFGAAYEVAHTVHIPWAVVIGARVKDVFPFVSYFFYGLAAFMASLNKIKKLFTPSKKRDDAFLIPPKRYPKLTIFSATFNFLVFILYTIVAVIFASLLFTDPLVPLVGAPNTIAAVLAAVGTFLGWLANDVVNAWQARREFNDIDKLNNDFPCGEKTVEDLTKKLKLTSSAEIRHAFFQFFMVVGMSLLAGSFMFPTPSVPFITFVEVSYLRAASMASFGIFALPMIASGLKSILSYICCCGCLKNRKRGVGNEAGVSGLGNKEMSKLMGPGSPAPSKRAGRLDEEKRPLVAQAEGRSSLSSLSVHASSASKHSRAVQNNAAERQNSRLCC